MIEDKREIVVREIGTRYDLPEYNVVDGVGIEKTGTFCGIQFVRGSKIGEGIEKVTGILHESLLSMMITDLKYKNTLVPSRESSLVITKLEEALMWLEERQRSRIKAGIQGTYLKTGEIK